MTPSPAQSLNWGLLANATGVQTEAGVPKLELMTRNIMKRAEETGKSPERVRDEGLQGLEHWMLPYMLAAPVGAAAVTQRQD